MNRITVVLPVIILLILGGCAKKEKPAIEIGEIKVTADEFKEAFRASRFAEYKELGHADFLNTFLKRKLILKEAERLGLDKDPEFLKDVQYFWEQSLLKLVLARQSKELASTIIVSDREIDHYYQTHKEKDFPDAQLSDVYSQIKWFLLKKKQNNALDAWVEALSTRESIVVNEKLLGIKK